MRLALARTYVKRPEDVRFLRHVQERLDEREAFMGGETTPDATREAHSILLTGATGAGKSRLIARAFADDPRLRERVGERECPRVSVKLLGTTTLKAVGLMIVAKVGYPMHAKSTDHAIFHELHERLKLAKTRLLHVDEFQNVSDTADKDERLPIRETVKSLVISDEHPVIVVLSGLESMSAFFDEDPQLVRRGWSTNLPSLGDEDRDDVWTG